MRIVVSTPRGNRTRGGGYESLGGSGFLGGGRFGCAGDNLAAPAVVSFGQFGWDCGISKGALEL